MERRPDGRVAGLGTVEQLVDSEAHKVSGGNDWEAVRNASRASPAGEWLCPGQYELQRHSIDAGRSRLLAIDDGSSLGGNGRTVGENTISVWDVKKQPYSSLGADGMDTLTAMSSQRWAADLSISWKRGYA